MREREMREIVALLLHFFRLRFFFLVSLSVDAAAALSLAFEVPPGEPLTLRMTSQTQQEGEKKFSLLILCPVESRLMSFFLMYFCLQRLMKPKGSDIWLEHGWLGVLVGKEEGVRLDVVTVGGS